MHPSQHHLTHHHHHHSPLVSNSQLEWDPTDMTVYAFLGRSQDRSPAKDRDPGDTAIGSAAFMEVVVVGD